MYLSRTSLRIIFTGTPDYAAYNLDMLLSYGYHIVGVITQPDRPSGRGNKIIPTPVKMLATKYKLPILQPCSLTLQEDYKQFIAELNADVMVVVAYGLIIPKNIITMLRFGCINVHYSLLPRWRGAAPVQRSLWAGDTSTGVTIIQMDYSLDAGDILYQISCPISNTDTSKTLYNKLVDLGIQGLIETLQKLIHNNLNPKKQDSTQVTFASKLSKQEARINWSLSALQLERCIRAFNPWPISWFEVDGQRIKIWKASVTEDDISTSPGTIIGINKYSIKVTTIKGIINLEYLQPAGKKIMNVHTLLNSYYYKWFTIGKQLT